MLITRPPYPAEFRRQIVDLVHAGPPWQIASPPLAAAWGPVANAIEQLAILSGRIKVADGALIAYRPSACEGLAASALTEAGIMTLKQVVGRAPLPSIA